MADISELLIEVKQINKTIGDIDLVNKKLKQTQATATSLGKSLFAGASFTALIASIKKFGDAWKQVIVTNKAFGTMFKKNIDIANKGVKELTKNFNETNVSAKKLLSTIKSRFGFDLISSKKTAEMATNMARLSHEVAAFYGTDVAAVSEKFNMALNGSSRALREFGINIDLNSPRMKKMIEEMRIAEGETEEGARALVIYNEILKRGQKYEGSFKTQAKTLSQAFGDIGNTLKSGMFAQAGQVLSAIFVPILEKINALLSQPWVQKIGGIALALGSIVGVIKSIQLAVAGLNATLLKFNVASPAALSAVNGFFNFFSTSLALYLKDVKQAAGKIFGSLGESLKSLSKFTPKFKNVKARANKSAQRALRIAILEQLIPNINDYIRDINFRYGQSFKKLKYEEDPFQSVKRLWRLRIGKFTSDLTSTTSKISDGLVSASKSIFRFATFVPRTMSEAVKKSTDDYIAAYYKAAKRLEGEVALKMGKFGATWKKSFGRRYLEARRLQKSCWQSKF